MNKNISILGLVLHIIIFFILYLIPFNLLSKANLTLGLILLLITYLTTFYLLYRFIFYRIPVYIFGIGVFVIGFLSNVIAIIFSPEYVMWEKSISILGSYHPGGKIMRIGLIISYNLAIPFFIKFSKALKDETINDNLRKLAVACGIFTSVTAMLTGTFSGINEFIGLLHGLFALMSWLGGVVVTLLYGFLMLKNSKFTKLIKNISFLITGILIFYLIPFFIVNFCNLFPETSSVYAVGRSIYLIMPTFEWIVIFSILFWYLFNSIYLLRENID